ncbi:MAG: hypothetical protein QOE92_591, partial [Chloroflexota bacterium]|nr:hypothetical protein [Chloroflexota bacterium]
RLTGAQKKRAPAAMAGALNQVLGQTQSLAVLLQSVWTA